MDQAKPQEEVKAQAGRRAYVKPRVEIVQLMPKQTVLGGCLSSSLGSGPRGNGCEGRLPGTKCVA